VARLTDTQWRDQVQLRIGRHLVARLGSSQTTTTDCSPRSPISTLPSGSSTTPQNAPTQASAHADGAIYGKNLFSLSARSALAFASIGAKVTEW